MTPRLLWLDDARATDPAMVGPKAARLATLHQAGLPVPPAFILTTAAFGAPLHEGAFARDLHGAWQRLIEGMSPVPPVAVRSSATAEDGATTSFAGLQETVLHVTEEAALHGAIRRVWASLTGEAAQHYRARTGGADGSMAVIIQRQVAATVAGVAFAQDPITGQPHQVIEAVAGLGDALVNGEAEPQRWRLLPTPPAPPRPLLAPDAPLLEAAPLAQLSVLVSHASTLFDAPQDVEWAWDGATLWLLQSRPITVQPADWFTDHLPEDDALWTAAFLNERFTQPVSPLGWTMVARPLARLALRAPLALLGADALEEPLLKLWRGHPYSRVALWQRLYKLFPAALLPEDAARYFPAGDVTLRHAPRRPTFGPHLVVNALRLLRAEGWGVSPLHNPQAWARYERRQAATLLRLRFVARQLPRAADPIPAALALLQETVALVDDLLALHRWSLLYADLFFSLLRRWLILRHGPAEGAARAAALTTQVESPTTLMNRELARLAQQLADRPSLAAAARAVAATPTDNSPTVPALIDFLAEVRHFLGRYGHRFFSLDLYDPPWEADLPGFLRFLLALAPRVAAPPSEEPRTRNPLLALTRDYLRLREAQRFHWQQVMALQRRVVLQMGAYWVAQGRLAVPEEVFGLTWQELLTGEPDGALAASRLARLHRLRAQAAEAVGWHYPDFLRGNEPLRADVKGQEWQGRPVSPGVARGPARLIAHPGDFERLRPGDILVTASPDPGWTPVFGMVAGMVTERGGQLSHGAVIAREYALPAVSGVAGLLAQLRDGEPLLVDGTQGRVVRLSEADG